MNVLAKAGIELGENGSVTPDQLKEKASEQFPPVRDFSFATSPRTNRQPKDWAHTESKKRKHRNRQTQKMKKPRTGGSGASRVPWGGTSDGGGERHHATCFTPFTGSLCRAFCLTSQRSSLSVAMFHYDDGKDLSQVSTSLRTWSLAMP